MPRILGLQGANRTDSVSASRRSTARRQQPSGISRAASTPVSKASRLQSMTPLRGEVGEATAATFPLEIGRNAYKRGAMSPEYICVIV